VVYRNLLLLVLKLSNYEYADTRVCTNQIVSQDKIKTTQKKITHFVCSIYKVHL